MAGIYFHIPFCRKACTYCNFHFSTSLRHRDEMGQAMLRELQIRSGELQVRPHTLYFGGGTPSLLPPDVIGTFIRRAEDLFKVSTWDEVTLEANPEDITAPNLLQWKASGITRLSLGVQSLDEEELRQMNRAHTAKEAMSAVDLILQSGIAKLSIDLIYGSPWLSDKQWEKNLNWALNSGASHLSAYGLTVEPRTALEKHIERHQVQDIDEEKQARQYRFLYETALRQGWDFYEISNLSKPGFRAKHNSSYWHGEPYLGIGPAAHSYDGIKRSWNIANNAKYLEGVADGLLLRESEVLTETNRYNEFVMTRLRLSEGISATDLGDYRIISVKEVINTLQKWTEEGLAIKEENRYSLTLEGRLVADYLSTQLML